VRKTASVTKCASTVESNMETGPAAAGPVLYMQIHS